MSSIFIKLASVITPSLKGKIEKRVSVSMFPLSMNEDNFSLTKSGVTHRETTMTLDLCVR